jgi:hypothetical protein
MPTAQLRTKEVMTVVQGVTGITIDKFKNNLAGQRIFKNTIVALCDKVYYDDIAFNWDKSSNKAAVEGEELHKSGRQLATTGANIAYELTYVLQFTMSGPSGKSPYVKLIEAIAVNATAKTSAFTKTLTTLAKESKISDMEGVEVAATATFAVVSKDYTAKTTNMPSSRPSYRPPPPGPPPTISSAGLIGLSVGVTIGGIGIIVACFLFSYTETFRTFRRTTLGALKDLKPRSPRKIKRPQDDEEEAKYELENLRHHDMELADLYRSRDTAFTHANAFAVQKLSAKKQAERNTPDPRSAARDAGFAGVPSKLDSIPDDDVPKWERKWSAAHNQWYWRHRFDGKVSWTNPESGNANIRSPNAAGTPEKGGGSVKGSSVKNSGGRAQSQSGYQEQPLPLEWEEKFSIKHQMPFWRNNSTGAISWTLPAEVEAERTSQRAMKARVAGLLTRDALRVKNARDEAFKKQQGAASVASSGFGIAGAIRGGSRVSGDARSVGSARSQGSHRSQGSAGSRGSNAESIHSRGSQRSQGSQRVRGGGAAAAMAAAIMAAEADADADESVVGYERKYSKKYGLFYWRSVATGEISWEKPTASSAPWPPRPPR